MYSKDSQYVGIVVGISNKTFVAASGHVLVLTNKY